MKGLTAGELGWNPVTGERSIVLEGPDENPVRRLTVELYVSPGGAVVGEHLHPAITERFEVLDGTLGVKLSGRKSEAGTGEAVDIPPRTWHDWWNAGDTEAVVKVTVTPGDRFSEMITTIFGLALDGRPTPRACRTRSS
jgi:quercetin dioxygenase-like cupin family protein